MSTAKELISTGHSAYSKGKYLEGESLYRLAVQVAVDGSDAVMQHDALLWEADCILKQNRTREALSKLLEMRLLEKDRPDAIFDPQIMWFCRITTFVCHLDNPNTLTALHENMQELRSYSETNSVSGQDVPLLQSILYYERGMVGEALAQAEKATANYKLGGYDWHGLCRYAADYSLRIGRFEAAREWCARMMDERTMSESDMSKDVIRNEIDLLHFEISRAESDAVAMQRHFSNFAFSSANMDLPFRGRQVLVRGALFVSGTGDPDARDHPARRALSRGPGTTDNLHILFGYALLVLDYRLACLRHSVGLVQNDDHWHKTEIPATLSLCDKSESLARLSRAGLVAAAAMRRAVHLDGVFECEWRQEDVKKRVLVLEAIGNALSEGWRA